MKRIPGTFFILEGQNEHRVRRTLEHCDTESALASDVLRCLFRIELKLIDNQNRGTQIQG
jgi:hypothetical protein